MKITVFAMSLLAAGFAFAANDAGYSVSRVSALQRWPWDNKVDIRFWLDQGTAKNAIWYGAEVDVSVTVGGVTTPIASSSLDKTTVYGEGQHTLVWTPTAEFPARVLEGASFAVTIREAPVAAAYLTVDLTTGERAAYGAGFASAVTNGVDYKSTKMAFRYCPPTTSDAWKAISGGKDYFVIGQPANGDGGQRPGTDDVRETPANIRLTHGFYLGVFPVTIDQWQRLGFSGGKSETKPTHDPAKTNGPYMAACGLAYEKIRGADGPNSPYCFPASRTVDPASYLGVLRARTGCDFDLPTEAQFEYACRAGTTTTFYGDYNTYFVPGAGHRRDVGSFPANPWGFYDMVCALHQWTTTLAKDASGNNLLHVAGDDPEGISPTWSNTSRIIKGGHIQADWNCVYRSAYRMGQATAGETASELVHDGFRLCLTCP